MPKSIPIPIPIPTHEPKEIRLDMGKVIRLKLLYLT